MTWAEYIYWAIVGFILFGVSLFFYTHTWTTKWSFREGYTLDEKLPLPLWAVAVCIFVSLFPVVNLSMFLIGLVVFIIYVNTNDCIFEGPKWMSAIGKFFNKNLNK